MLKKYCFILILLVWALCPAGGAYGFFGGAKEELGGIDSNVSFKLSNRHENYRNKIVLDWRSERIYSCCNTYIIARTSIIENNISIKFFGIYYPEIGLTALGPATGGCVLNIPNGIYNLQFQYKDKTDSYRLIVFKPFMKLISIKSTFTAPESDFFYKYSNLHHEKTVEEIYGNYLIIILLAIIVYIISVYVRIKAKKR